jgi:cupin fold WbuC family metalloprotein
MLIVLERRTYIRPHKHSGKSESFHIVEGVVDVVVLDDLGEIQEVIPMGDYASGRAFYWRHSDARYHTLLIRSERLVIHETTNGPFRADSTFAPWSPEESNKSGAQEFVSGLSRRVEEFLSQSEGRRRGSNT